MDQMCDNNMGMNNLHHDVCSTGLRLATWNIGGVMTNVNYLEKLLTDTDIMVIQEHWLYPESLEFLSTIHKDFVGWGRSSDNLNLNSVWRRGKGGIGILWRRSVDNLVEQLEHVGNDRIIVIKVTMPGESCLFIVGVYFPSANHSMEEFRRHTDLLEDTINQLCDQGMIIVLGDFNCHIGKYGGPRGLDRQNVRGRELIKIMQRQCLSSVNSQTLCTGPIGTYWAQSGIIQTTIDHILLNAADIHNVEYCCVKDDNHENLSYHMPIVCKLKLPTYGKNSRSTSEINGQKKRINWRVIENGELLRNYQKNVSENLPRINVGEIGSSEEVEGILENITETLLSAAEKSLPCKKARPYLKPYWKNGLKDLHSRSRMLRRVWIEHGRPRDSNNVYYTEYKSAKREFRKAMRRKVFHYEVEQNKRMEELFKNDRAKFQRITKNKRMPKKRNVKKLEVDGKVVTDSEQLLLIWKKHYEDLYTPKEAAHYDDSFKESVQQKLKEYVDVSLSCTDDVLDEPFMFDEVQEICLQLPNNKTGGLDGLVYEHVKYGGEELLTLLTSVLNIIRELEDVPNSMAMGLIISLYKGKKKNKLLKDSYRGITLLNVAGKILEHLMLSRMIRAFQNSGVPNCLQFSYQAGKSCIHASFVLQEVINEAVENGSKVYSCFLDSAKAFDTVWFDGLFYKLFNLGICGKTWRLLRKWYSKLLCCVSVNGLISDTFPVRQGIREGGVLSPWLYLCFNNDIYKILSECDGGLTVKSTYCGNVTVADDIVLLSPMVKGLQKLISEMENYSKKWRFEFNSGKSAIVVFGETTQVRNALKGSRRWFLNGKPIEEDSTVEHVGILLSGNFSATFRTAEAAVKGKETISSLMSAGVKIGVINPVCGKFIWNTFGLPKMLYGAEVWSNMTESDILTLERVNRFAAKRAQGLAITTMSEAAIGSLGLWTIEGSIDKKKLLFLRTLINSHPKSVEKKLFVERLTMYLCEYPSSSVKHGFLPDIIKILKKYNLQQYLDGYIIDGVFPSKPSWKRIICESIAQQQWSTWRDKLRERSELDLFRRVHTELQPLDLWRTAWRNPVYMKPLASLVNIFCGNIPSEFLEATNEIDSRITCSLCDKDVKKNVVKHFFMSCVYTADTRNDMWDTFHDKLPIGICARLFSEDDESMYETLVSGKLPYHDVSDEMRDEFAIIVALGVVHILKKINRLLNLRP